MMCAYIVKPDMNTEYEENIVLLFSYCVIRAVLCDPLLSYSPVLLSWPGPISIPNYPTGNVNIST